MKLHTAAILLGFAAAALPLLAADPPMARPKAGKVEILPLDQVKAGMKGSGLDRVCRRHRAGACSRSKSSAAGANMWGPEVRT
jgi:hypothetical protein